MNCPKVLIFAPLCYPPAGPEAIVTSKLVLGMIEAGWQVKVISQADFGRYFPTNINNHWEPLSAVVENIYGLRVNGLITRILKSEFTNPLRTLLWIVKAICSGLVALKKEKYDCILSRVAPQYGHLPALVVSMISGTPWIANWSDPMPPQKAPPPYGSGIHAKISFFLNMYCRIVFRYADWHTFPCERLMKYYGQMAPEITSKSSVIPHIALNKFRIKQDENSDVFSLCHTGGLSLRDPYIFFEGLKRFIKDANLSKDMKIIFIGDPVDEIKRKVKEAGLEAFIIIEAPKTYEEAQSRAASSGVLLVIEALCEEGIFFPSKFVDFIQTGRPILAISPRIGTLSDIISRHGGGIAVDNSNPEAVCKALTMLYEAWKSDPLMPAYSSNNLFDLFCANVVLEKYDEIFRSLDLKGALRQ